MANLYTPYDGGLFESAFQVPFILKDDASNSLGNFTMDNEYVIEGSKSGKLTITSDTTIISGAKQSRSSFYFRSTPGSGEFNIISLSPGRYQITLNAITPSGNPVADDNALVMIGTLMDELIPNPSDYTVTDLGGGKYKITFTGAFGVVEYIAFKVSALKDTLQELSYTFDDNAANLTSFRQFLKVNLTILLNNPTGNHFPIATTQNLLVGGKLFFDEMVLDLAPPPCSLAFGTPAYTKTDETVLLNDGTITVNASGVGTPQYQLDAGSFQLSNLFTGVAPGSHTITVKDSSPCGTITTPVIILAFDAPDPPPPPPAGPLTLDEQPVNSYNLISWFNVVGQIGFEGGIECINEFWDLPRAYRLLGFTKRHYAVAMQAEDFSFYINFDEAITYPNFTSLRVALVTSAGVVKLDCGQLFKDANTDGSYNIYATLNLDATIPEGKYRLLIYDQDTTATLFISSGLEVMTEDNAKKYTARLINRNTYDIYKYYYSRVPNYVNQIRMNVNVNDEQPEAAIISYRAVSNGRLRNVNIELDKWIQLEIYFWDDNAIRGMYVFQICDTININGKDYLIKDIYKTTWNPKLCVNKGLVSFYEQEFSTANRFGIPGNLTIVGSDDPLLLGDGGGFIKL